MTTSAEATPVDAPLDAPLDAIDRAIINGLQGGFPVCERPYAAAAADLGLSEDALIERLSRLLDGKVLTRFGPLYDPVALGGAVTLAAMAVPDDQVDHVAAVLDHIPEVAHNYLRTHALNMWFVAAADSEAALAATLDRIARATGYTVHNFPKEREYFLNLRLEA